MRTLDVIIAAGAAGAIVGIVQWAMLGYDSLDNRPEGALSHYMTYSGVLMLVTCAAIARLVFSSARVDLAGYRRAGAAGRAAIDADAQCLDRRRRRRYCLLALRNWKLALLAPLAAIGLLFLAPGDTRIRALSMFDPNHPSNRDRVSMVHVGIGMIRDHPVWRRRARNGRRCVCPLSTGSEYVNPVNPHLHNVPMQIAAERGLLALAAWLWFFAVALYDSFRRVRRGQTPAISAAAFAALVAMLVAGLFEYNFGDSEFLMLLLGLISLPFAAEYIASQLPARRTT